VSEADDPGETLSGGTIGMLVVVMVLVACFVGWAMLRGRRLERVSAAAHRLAVLPFTTTPDDTALSRTGEELAVRVGVALGAIPGVQVVDPVTVLVLAHDSAGHPLAAARAGGAETYAGGTLRREGARIAAAIELVPVDSGYRSSIVVHAPADDPVALADSVARAVLFKIWRSHHMPTPDAASATNGAREAWARVLAIAGQRHDTALSNLARAALAGP
jgi:TolB-like protein